MSELIEKVREEVATYADPMGYVPDVTDEVVAARILALIARALLSDDVVTSAADAMYITVQSEPGTYPLIYMEDVPDFRTGLQAALAAAGITGAGQEGGEGE